ncbi:unnamed protein product [Brassica napus]|uniref:(rape) hypothetical protein n=1 Tax=Brassica napus TaxID=3708 RepID=A0A816P2F7_BRANA|nr:unnamed protein product [Brassica napus]CAF2246516.1 unnamed protein product [Brassica napus]
MTYPAATAASAAVTYSTFNSLRFGRPPLSLKREEKWSAAFWKMVTWSLQDEDGTRDEEDEEKCYLEYPNVEDVDNV